MSETLDQIAEQNGTLGEAMEQPLPQGAQPSGEQPPVEEPAEQQETFEVDGKVFADEKTAFDYLKKRNTELEAERMVEAARIEGMQEALRYSPTGQVPQQVQDQVQDDPSMDLDEFYANPVEYLAKQRQKIKEEVMTEVTSQQTTAQRNEQVWRDFSNRHPRLADMKDIVELVASQHKEVVQAMASRNPEKAYDFVAAKVNEKLAGFVEAGKPTRELPQTKGGPSAGSNQPVTPQDSQTKNNKPLDFISQVKQHRNR